MNKVIVIFVLIMIWINLIMRFRFNQKHREKSAKYTNDIIYFISFFLLTLYFLYTFFIKN